MNLRLLNRMASGFPGISSRIRYRASKLTYFAQVRDMSKNKNVDDGAWKKGSCAGGSQFFEGCFKKMEKNKCPKDKPENKKGGCRNPCKDGPCKQK